MKAIAFGLAALLACGQIGNAQDADQAYKQGMRLAGERLWSDARQAFLRGRTAAPSDKRFPLELAGVAYKLGDRAEAKKQFRRALHIDPSDAYANDAMGSLYLLENNLAAALLYWNRVNQPLIRRVNFSSPILRRAIEVNPGDVMRSADFERTMANFDRLRVGARKVQLSPDESQQGYNLQVEADRGGTFGGNWLQTSLSALSSLPYQAVRLSLQPPKTGLANIDLMFRWDLNKKLASAYASGLLSGNPHLLYTAGGDARQEIWQIRGAGDASLSLVPFRMEKVQGLFQIEHGITGRLRWINGISAAGLRFSGVSTNSSTFANGIELKTASRISYEVVRLPEQRISVTADGMGEFGRLLSNPKPFHRVQSGIEANWLPGTGDSAEIRGSFRAGMSGGDVPFDQLFMLGMERDSDLWLRGHVATYDGRKGNGPLGKNYLLSQTDATKTLYRRPFLRLQLGPFLDIGRVSGVFEPDAWLVDAGLEARVRVSAVTWVVVVGNDLRNGGTVVYTAVRTR